MFKIQLYNNNNIINYVFQELNTIIHILNFTNDWSSLRTYIRGNKQNANISKEVLTYLQHYVLFLIYYNIVFYSIVSKNDFESNVLLLQIVITICTTFNQLYLGRPLGGAR